MEKSSFEIKYCPERKENVSIQVEQGENGVIRRCLCGGECERKECRVCEGAGFYLWKGRRTRRESFRRVF